MGIYSVRGGGIGEGRDVFSGLWAFVLENLPDVTTVWVQFLIVVEYHVRLWVSVEVASWRTEIGAGAVAVYLPSAAALGPARFQR